MALARLRELLGDTNAIRLSNGCLTLDARLCWVDSWAFERRLSSAEARLPSGDLEGAHQALEAAMALYRGPFLQADTTSPWSIELRERLRSRLLRAVASVGEALVDAGEDSRAVHLHERALEADPLAEALYLGLIRIHDRLGRRPEAIEAYERCRRVLASHGLTVSHETEAVRRTL
jgi:two-component SAPR family response regulator